VLSNVVLDRVDTEGGNSQVAVGQRGPEGFEGLGKGGACCHGVLGRVEGHDKAMQGSVLALEFHLFVQDFLKAGNVGS